MNRIRITASSCSEDATFEDKSHEGYNVEDVFYHSDSGEQGKADDNSLFMFDPAWVATVLDTNFKIIK